MPATYPDSYELSSKAGRQQKHLYRRNKPIAPVDSQAPKNPPPPKGGNMDSNILVDGTTPVICLDDYHSLDRLGRKENGVTALNPRANNFDLVYHQYTGIRFKMQERMDNPAPVDGRRELHWKILRVRLVIKEDAEYFDPEHLFDEDSTIDWIPCGRKLTCSYPGIKFYYGRKPLLPQRCQCWKWMGSLIN